MVRLPNWVGDAVMAEPALRELRRIFAHARITFAARPGVAGLFQGEGLADDTIIVRNSRGIARATDFVRDTRLLRRARFDLAVLLQNAFGAALQARAARAKAIAGYATDSRRPLLDLIIPFESGYKRAHQVRYYLNIAAALERAYDGESRVDLEGQPQLHVTGEEQARARQMLQENGIKLEVTNQQYDSGALRESVSASPRRPVPASPLLALCPGATNSRAKRWLPERFATTADRLAVEAKFRTIIVGGTGEIDVAREVASRMKSQAVVLAGRTDTSTLKAILSCASLVVSNDTGTAHVAAALNVPTVVVFGPTEHHSTRPLSDWAAIVRKDVQCSPCMLRDCPIDHRCMTGVEVDDVYLAVRNLPITVAR